MKKTFLLLALFFVWAGTFAQTISVGLDAGLNLAKLPFSIDGLNFKSNYMQGYNVFHAGVLVDVNWGAFSIQPGVLYSVKGGQSTFSGTQTEGGLEFNITDGSSTVILHYIEVPVNLIYRLDAGPGNIFIGGGPYLGYAISGNALYQFTASNALLGIQETTAQPIDLKKDGDLKNPDIGANGLFGYQFNFGLAVKAQYGYGLISSKYEGASIRNQVYSFSLCYFFGNHKSGGSRRSPRNEKTNRIKF